MTGKEFFDSNGCSRINVTNHAHKRLLQAIPVRLLDTRQQSIRGFTIPSFYESRLLTDEEYIDLGYTLTNKRENQHNFVINYGGRNLVFVVILKVKILNIVTVLSKNRA